MSARPSKAVLERVPAAVDALPSLALLFHKTMSIAGTGKRKIDGTYAATRLGRTMTSRWANERFRQVMLLIRQFRMEWPNQALLTADDTELIRTAMDVALSTAAHEAHTGDIYDLNPTTWAIWMVQYVYAVRKGSWTAESAQAQRTLSFETLYAWLKTQHERGEQFYVYESGTKIILHRYKLPFKKMVVPPKQNELFKWRKGAKRLSDWMVQGGFAPIAEGIGSLQPPTLVAPPPQQSQREARRAAMWERVASRARARRLTSVEGEGEDATLTRTVVRSVMDDSRANEPRSREMTDEEADAFALELEAELESQQAAAEPPAQASSSSSPSQASRQALRRRRRRQALPQSRCRSTSKSGCATSLGTGRCSKGWASLRSRWCPRARQARPPQKGGCALLLARRREGRASSGRRGTMQSSRGKERPPLSPTTRTSGSPR